MKRNAETVASVILDATNFSMKPMFLGKHMWAAGLLVASVLCACSSSRNARSDARATSSVAHANKKAGAMTQQDSEAAYRYNEFFLESVRLREKGDYAASYELLRHALAINPNASEALYEMAQISEQLYPDSALVAEELYKKAVSLGEDNFYYMEALADFYLRRNRVAEGCDMYEKMVTRCPERSDVLYNLVALYGQQQQYEPLINSLNRLEEQEGKSENISMEKAKAYIELKQPKQAFAEIENLCSQYPGDLRYKVILGDLYLQNEHPESALKIYRQVLDEEPDNAYAHISLLNYYRVQNQDSLYRVQSDSVALNPHVDSQIRAAVMNSMIMQEQQGGLRDTVRVQRIFKKILAQPQDDNRLLAIYADYLTSKKMPIDSIAPTLERMLVLEPENSVIRLRLLEYCLRGNRMQEAATLCRAGCQYSPDETAYFYYGGIALFQLKQNDEALRMLQSGSSTITNATSGDLASDYYALLGDIYHESGQVQQSYLAYDSALIYKPDNLMCLNNYAYFLSLEKVQLSKAAEMSKKTIEAEPTNATFLDTYAWILFEQGRVSEAKIYVDEMLKNATQTKENATLYEHAGDVYSKLGFTGKAVDFWRTALQLGADSAFLKKKIKLRKYVTR